MQPWEADRPCSPGLGAGGHARRPVGPRTSVCCRPDAARATVPTADAGALRRHRTRVGQGRPDPMRTRLTDLLGVEHPVMLAGMGGVSYAELAAAVSSAGGFGCLGASTMGDDKMVEEMAAVRAVTDKPFGVDLLTAMPGGMTEQVKLVIEGGASAFVAGLGVPTEVVDLCHDHDVIVVSMCGKVEHAVRAVEAGCDLVVAQGTEARGHTR